MGIEAQSNLFNCNPDSGPSGMRPQVPALVVVVVTWNVEQLIIPCLHSVYEAQSGPRLEVWVVDNASSDETTQIVRRQFPEARLTINQTNRGFPQANNQAIRQTQSKYVLMLNPDTVLHPDALRLMHDYMEAHPQVGAVGPKILRGDGTIQYECAHNLPTLWTLVKHVFYISQLFPQSRWLGGVEQSWWDHQDTRAVEGLSGACMMIRRTALEQVGLLDEQMPMYLEDIDLCAKLGRAGWSLVYVANAQIIHYSDPVTGVGASTQLVVGRDPTYFIMPYQAQLAFLARYLGHSYALLARLVIVCGFGLRVCFSLLYLLAAGLGLVDPVRARYRFVRNLAVLQYGLGLSVLNRPK